MTCWKVERRIPAYLEQGVSESERHLLNSHFRKCSGCALKAESQRQVRTSLLSLPRLAPPKDLTMRLRVAASKERLKDRRPGSSIRRWESRTKLALNNLMKPIALPAAGGLCAALLLFMTLMPAFTFNRATIEDVPLNDLTPSTAPTLKSLAPMGFQYGDAEVDLRIDDQGRIINYSILGGAGHDQDSLHRSIENSLLFTTFTPATAYGVPTSSKLRLSFRSSRIDVRG